MSSSSPTMAPIIQASSAPTAAPTVQASSTPTAAPSPSPTVQDSQSPTVLGSVITPSATTQQSSEFSCDTNVCLNDGTWNLSVPAGEASNAIDGNTDGDYFAGSSSHTWDQWNPYWQVEGISGPVSKVKVWNRSDYCTDRLVGATVNLLDNSGAVLSTRDIEGIAASWELDFGSVSGVATVRITKAFYGPIVLPEVEVLGSSGTSLLNGSSVASQSSKIDCENCYRGIDASGSLVLDGDTNGNFNDGTVFHTMNQVDPWLRIDLGLTATVSRVNIWNRSDCCWERLVGAKMQLLDSSGNILHTETVGSISNSFFSFAPVKDVTAVLISLENTAPTLIPLNLAEVEVFGTFQ